MSRTCVGVGLALSALAVSCGWERSGIDASTVGGVVTYRHEIALPPAARLVVALADVTASEALILVEDTLADLGASPIAFDLPYDSSTIDTSHVYAIAARIVVGGDVLFASPVSHEVITFGNPLRVEIPIEPATLMGPLPPRAGDIATRLATLRRIDGSWQDGDAASVISAYFEGGALRYLEERMTIGQYGSAVNAYYFEEGALFYHETIKQVRSAGQPPDAGDEIAFRVLFGPDGVTTASSKWINGESGELDDAELQTALRHAAVIREAVLRLAAERS